MEIGKIIYNRRTELGLTLEEVGNAVGVSKSTVKKWEDGFISNMKRDKIAELSKVLKLSPISLIMGDECSLQLESNASIKEQNPAYMLNANEKRLLVAFKQLTSVQQEIIIEKAELLVESNEAAAKKKA